MQLFLVEAIAIFFVAIAVCVIIVIQLVLVVIAILIPYSCESQIFFFWNRLLGIVVGFAIRLFMWKSSKVHVTIGKPDRYDRRSVR